MPNILLIGQVADVNKYIGAYVEANEFLPYEVESYEERLTIAEARKIKQSLSFVHNKRLFIVTGEPTIGSQNALLKILEELGANIHFIFSTSNVEKILSTVRSRCQEVVLKSDRLVDDTIYNLVKKTHASGVNSWEAAEELGNHFTEMEIVDLVPVMRFLLLENVGNNNYDLKYFYECKKLLYFLPLVEKNNVNKKIAIESIFLGENTS